MPKAKAPPPLPSEPPEPPPEAAPVMHLAASLRVVSSHLHTRHASIEAARSTVLRAAEEVAAGQPPPEIVRLVARLEKVTGAGIAELAGHAERWA